MTPNLPGIGVDSPTLSGSTPANRKKSEQIREAARDFEALLIQQLLRSAREAGAGAGMGSDDQSFDSIMDFSEQQIARMLTASGGLGLSSLIARGLESGRAEENAPPAVQP